MRKKALLTLAVVAVLAIGVTAIASNMGFKISIALTAGATKNNFVSIPFYNSYGTAALLFNDITGCTQVSRWDNTANAYQTWTGARGTNFTTTAGEGYNVKVSGALNWIVVGSHNPSASVSLIGGATKNNFLAVPYHTTATTAATLFNQLTGCTQVSRWDNTANAYQTWTGARGTNFTLTAGEAVNAKVSASIGWTPAHY